MVSEMIRVLMIGNSFSICVCNNLPQIVEENEECRIHLVSAYIGGCSLERHWNNFVETEADPAKRQYGVRRHGYESGNGNQENPASLQELLSMEDWDVVTIQQASHESWNYGRYQPYADNLIEKIKALAPNARILIQQTWAYRADDPRIREGGAWGFDQQGMHERARAAYHKLADHTGFMMIPTGDAVAISREKSRKKFVPYADGALWDGTYTYPDLPPQASDVVGSLWWKKNENSQEMEIARDTIHLNKRGEYLQACVWFGFLYAKDPRDIKYVPDSIGKSDAEFLRQCAYEALNPKSRR